MPLHLPEQASEELCDVCEGRVHGDAGEVTCEDCLQFLSRERAAALASVFGEDGAAVERGGLAWLRTGIGLSAQCLQFLEPLRDGGGRDAV